MVHGFTQAPRLAARAAEPVRNQARRPDAESQALALVVNERPEWTVEIRTNRMTAAGWTALPKAIQDEAEAAYATFYGMPMPDVEDGA